MSSTATFNYQYNADPYELDTTGLVQQALEYGIRAFDTSPYYGPSEEILGAALDTPFVRSNVPREQYFLLTKVGRIAGDEFDYSKEWVRQSVARSLQRLKTEYLDVVYCHGSGARAEADTGRGRHDQVCRYFWLPSAYSLFARPQNLSRDWRAAGRGHELRQFHTAE
jgi:aryl-alcohol dehydrogenase-like predicted oxidoreductase